MFNVTISLSIEYLFIGTLNDYIGSLRCLFELTPRLQELTIKNTYNMMGCRSISIYPSLISLTTSFHVDNPSVINILQRLPNLCYLTLETWNIIMNGYDWKELIINNLPKLKVFRLKMIKHFKPNDNIYELIDSFRTDFWIKQHQWYVRCDCYYSSTHEFGTLYALPYTFNKYFYFNSYDSGSTKCDNKYICRWNNVQYMENKNITRDSFNDLSLLNTRFPNIIHFEITFPLTDYIGFNNVSYIGLTSLSAKLSNAMDYYQLQKLLDQMPNLYLLQFKSFGRSPEGIFQLKSSSIRRLDLMKAQLIHENRFSNEDCINLINSPLGRQCEVLFVEIENRTNILDLINKMPHLRVLNFRCKDVIWDYSESLSIDKESMRWLKENLSTKCSIVTDEKNRLKICIWIYRETNESLSTDDFLFDIP